MAKYNKEALSLKSLLALGKRNHIVQDVLISFDLNESSETSIWYKALAIMVSELVEYCERVMIERYDQYLSGVDDHRINSLPELGRENVVTRSKILEIARSNSIVNKAIKTCTFDRRIDWVMALMMAVEAMDDESKRLTKALEISEQYKPQMQLVCNLSDLPDKERAIILDALKEAKND